MVGKSLNLKLKINQSEQYAQQLMQMVLKQGFESS